MEKEENKIVFFNTNADTPYIVKLSKIANSYSISGRKALQLCLASEYGFISTPGLTRHKDGGGAKHFFLPFTENEYIRVNTKLANLGIANLKRVAFKTLCKRAIDKSYDLLFNKNKHFDKKILAMYVEQTTSKIVSNK